MNIELFKISFQELWQNQPGTVIGLATAILVFLGIYIALLNTYN